MTSFYRITVLGGVETAYTRSRAAAQEIADFIRGNGYVPVIRKLTKMQIPLQDIHIVNEL